MVLFVRSPWGQGIIVDEVTDYVSEKVDTKFKIGKLYLTFSGNLTLEELYLEDRSQDTLVYSKYLEANVPFRPLLFGDEIQVDFVKWDGLKANIIRKDSIEGFNFQYIIDAFAVQGESESTTQKNTENTTEISVGSISFTDFDLTYYDEVTGIDSELHLGSLEVDSETIDLQNMKFHLSEVSLSDTSIAFSQTKPAAVSEDEEEVALPWILVDELSLLDVNINYNSSPDGIASEAYIDDFNFSELDANLDTQVVALDQLVWKDSRVKLEMESSSASGEKTEEVAESSQGFSWPQWKVNVNAIDFQNQTIEINQNGKRPARGVFSAEALSFKEFNFKLNDLIVSKDENLRFNLNDLRFQEGSGLVLKEFQMQTRLTSEEATLNDLRLKLNNSLVFADFNLKYVTLDDLINSPFTSTLEFDVSRLKVNVKDAYVFSSELKTNDQLRNLAQHNFEGNFKAEGNLEKLRVFKFNLNWGENTQLQLKGDLSQFTDVDNLGFNITNLTAKSNKQDLSEFISEEDLGISLPETVTLTGDFKKEEGYYSTKSLLKSALGYIQLDGYFNSSNTIDYRVNFDIKSLKLGELLENKELGDLSMQLNSKGNGNSIDELTAELSSSIDSIRWNAYTFSGMEINGNLEDGNGDVRFDYTDENLKFDFVSNIELDSVFPKVDLKFNLEGINTRELGFTSKDIRAKLLANVQFEGNSNQFKLDAQLEDARVVYDNSSYDLGNFDFSSKVDSTQSTAEVSSLFLNGNLQANHDIGGILNALKNHFEKYTKASVLSDKSVRPVNFDADLKFIDFPILSEVFFEGIQEMDTLRASIHFDEENNQLTSSLKLPYLSYNDSEIVGLNLDLNSTGDFAEFKFVLDNIVAGPLDVAKTQLDGEFKDSQLNLNLNAFKDDKDYFSSAVSISFEDEELYRLNVSPDKLILNGSPWIIPEDNEIVYQNDTVKVTNFKFTRNRQEIELTNKLDFENYHLGIVFDNFRLSTITNYLNPDDKLASGKLSGNLVVIEPFSSNGLISNLDIEDLRITEVPLGNLAFKAEASSGDNYKLNLSLKDAGIDLAVNGIYQTNTSETTVDFDIDLRTLEMQTLEKFATDYIKNSNGNLKGDFEVNGPLDELDYKGFLAFDGVQFNLSTLNTLLQFKNERIELTKNKVSFDNFTVADQQDNTLTTSGFIDVEELINPKFDLSFDANNFQLLNSTAEDNDLYYGKLVFDASAKLNGNLDLPKVDLNLSIKEETDLTYIVPESRASIEERDGVVVFVNKDHPDNILTKKDDEELKVVLTGIDLNSTINIQKQSKVAVVFNERTGDNVVVQGGGDFKFSISRTGKMNLVGKYEVTDGSVELNFYNIVKRKFNIAPSSSVTWNGNPYNADLDLRAIYKVETSASSLMAFQTAGENVATQNRYKQQLPFFVYMDVGDELMSPELSFKLDMPEDRQGVASGSVYGRISQVNQEEDQLNKQVFSLLVLNRFYPVSGSDGSQGGPATIARDNINQALSDQLNRFSDKLTGNTGVSLNFDVNSYTDYQGSTAQERTDVDISAQKKLFDDRLVVEAGSQVNVQGDQRPGESQGVVGNVSVEYLLTEDGRWKLRGFRKSEYENVIDGQVFISGIALIFTREFNKFKVLWDSAYRESLKEKEVEVETESKEDSEDKQEPETKTNE
ncbi:translocation/assembly module TamB domain-containing protein [Psychroflexus sp. CAK57W]|uniref:translocation/assembly module TamB domain-containing protein n=1 Tax=Psychroflexus curvus TaxID=2873595 RepID=UPI001CCA35B2|nr:translocation/assembly module TamB [Psychroflexus curvus]MBZ9788054.1 translocation/assembly module TamB domain-containing protein [Psychroflexus curvus]